MMTNQNSGKSALHRSAPLHPPFLPKRCRKGACTKVTAPLHRRAQTAKRGKHLNQSTFAPLPRERSEFYELLSLRCGAVLSLGCTACTVLGLTVRGGTACE
jgi:hypothetical protein